MTVTKARLRRAAWRDATIIFSIAAAVLAFFIAVEAFEYVVAFSDTHESWELDEILTLMMVMPIALAIFSYRRLREAERELMGRIEAERLAQEMALHDPLTGLPNRRHITDEIDQALARADKAPVAILLVDLNRFKAVNDMLGHLAGDQLLVEIAERLVAASGPKAIVSRLGGDEFVILIKDAPEGDELVAKVAEISEVFDEPFALGAGSITSGACIGITRVAETDVSASVALSQADAAMYGFKSRGRNGYRFFEEGMEEAARRRAEVESQLADAIAMDLIEPYYQPLVALRSGEIIGYEVLARWHLADGSIRLPADFIQIAEDTGLICDMYYGVLRKAAQEARLWAPELTFSMNLSPVQFADEWLVEKTLKILTEAGVAPGRLEIEITENALVQDVPLARRVIEGLKRQGIRVALDDFGTGYSSLRHLSELSFDMLKIDRSFVHDLDTNETSQTIVRTVTSMAHSLGIKVTVEGVDSPLNADRVLGYGCDIAQGYLYGEPARGGNAAARGEEGERKDTRAA